MEFANDFSYHLRKKYDINQDECVLKQHKKPLMAARLNAVTHRATHVFEI